MALPKRWEMYSNVGKVIPGTRIICFKVPLMEQMLRQFPKKLWFTPAMLVADLKAQGLSLGLVIDLTNTTRYYDKREITCHSIHYEKIFCEGQILPQNSVVKQFNSIIERFYKENADNDLLIGIHCTHGLNRTGYLVCRYMIEKWGYEPEDAFKVFEAARGHKMEKERYMEDLRGRRRITESEDKDSFIAGIQQSNDHSEDRHTHHSNNLYHSADNRRYYEPPGDWYSERRLDEWHRDRPRGRHNMPEQRFQRDEYYPPQQPFFTNTPFHDQYLGDHAGPNSRYPPQAGHMMHNQGPTQGLPHQQPRRIDDRYRYSNTRQRRDDQYQ